MCQIWNLEPRIGLLSNTKGALQAVDRAYQQKNCTRAFEWYRNQRLGWPSTAITGTHFITRRKHASFEAHQKMWMKTNAHH